MTINDYFTHLYQYSRGERTDAPTYDCPAKSLEEAVEALREAGWMYPEQAANLHGF